MNTTHRLDLGVRIALLAVMMTAGVGKLFGEHRPVLDVVFQVDSNFGRWVLATDLILIAR